MSFRYRQADELLSGEHFWDDTCSQLLAAEVQNWWQPDDHPTEQSLGYTGEELVKTI